MKGGISYLAKGHSKANNKYMKCFVLMQIICMVGQ